jgi:hypothetical protein
MEARPDKMPQLVRQIDYRKEIAGNRRKTREKNELQRDLGIESL